jgi:hypothetical protein
MTGLCLFDFESWGKFGKRIHPFSFFCDLSAWHHRLTVWGDSREKKTVDFTFVNFFYHFPNCRHNRKTVFSNGWWKVFMIMEKTGLDYFLISGRMEHG